MSTHEDYDHIYWEVTFNGETNALWFFNVFENQTIFKELNTSLIYCIRAVVDVNAAIGNNKDRITTC